MSLMALVAMANKVPAAVLLVRLLLRIVCTDPDIEFAAQVCHDTGLRTE